MKLVLNYKNKKIELDVEKCSGINRFLGLMFKSKNSKNLLFEFNKEKNLAIHSLFCPKFLVIWINNNEIVAFKIVKPFKLNVKPAGKFTRLIEIPVNSRNSRMMNFIVGK